MKIMLFAIPVFFILIGVELIVERWHQRQLYRFNDAVSNISCGITQQVVGVFYKAISMLAYYYIYLNWAPYYFPNEWWSYILLFLGIDCLYYWFHRYAHEISLFWGTHVVHHQSEDYNLSVALRQSAFQGLISGAFYLPLAFLGFDPIPFMLINTMQTLYQFWIHTETIDKMPAWFEYIFNTPSHHRVHHGRNPQYIDKNHGGTLIIFDRMFGTFQAEEEPVVYGVTKPLKTWNPVWANFDFYRDLWTAIQQTKGLGNKLRMLWKKPGWRPDSEGGPLEIPQIERTKVAKYHTIVPNGISIYIFIHFVLLLAFATIFLATLPQSTETPTPIGFVFQLPVIISAALIIWTAANFGLMADRRKLVYGLELLRLVSFPLLGFVLLEGDNTAVQGWMGMAIFISLISLLYFARRKSVFIY